MNRLWSYFVPVPPDAEDRARRSSSCTSTPASRSGPVVAAILKHPLLYEGPRMVKSPVVYTAGLLRQRGDRIETADWVWLDAMAGQQLFYPPNVARLGRDALARHLDLPRPLADRAPRARRSTPPTPTTPRRPTGRRPTRRSSSTARSAGGARCRSRRRRARRSSTTPTKTMAAAIADDNRQKAFPVMAYNALRHLAAVSPEMQTA